jgi:superfamily II DNA or RNA helicase
MHGVLSAVVQGQGADPDLFSPIITDEAHHSTARSYEGVFVHFSAAWRLFLTANMMRHDRLCVDCDIISIRSFVWAAQHDYIKKPILTVVRS